MTFLRIFQLAAPLLLAAILGECFNVKRATSSIPQYRFHYYVHDERTGDFKTQEESRLGDSVKGSYSVGEPNGDLRTVNYVADAANGFKADVNVQAGGSPISPTSSINPVDTNPINMGGFGMKSKSMTSSAEYVVKHQQPYPFYEEMHQTSPPTPSSSPGITTTQEPPTTKSIQVELNYLDESRSFSEKESNETEPQSVKQPEPTTVKYIPDIPSSIMQILNQHKSQAPVEKIPLENISTDKMSEKLQILEESSVKSHSTDVEMLPATTAETVTEYDSALLFKKANLPQKPLRLIGLPPVFFDGFYPQLPPQYYQPGIFHQIHLEPFGDISLPPLPHMPPPQITFNALATSNQFQATPQQFQAMPIQMQITPNQLLSAPTQALASTFASSNKMSNSRAISPPIMEDVINNKPLHSNSTPLPLPMCNDCVLPPNFLSYPAVVKIPPQPSSTTSQKPCGTSGAANNTTANSHSFWNSIWNPFKHSPSGYYLVPTPQIVRYY